MPNDLNSGISIEDLKEDYSYIFDASPGIWLRGEGENAEPISINKMSREHVENSINMVKRAIMGVSVKCKNPQALNEFQTVAERKISELQQHLEKLSS